MTNEKSAGSGRVARLTHDHIFSQSVHPAIKRLAMEHKPTSDTIAGTAS
jgi:hypothetical protein